MLLSVLLLVYLSAYLVGILVFPYVGMPLAPDILVCPSFFWDVRRVPLAVLLFDNIPLPGYVGVPCCLRPGACEFYVGVLRFSLFLKMVLVGHSSASLFVHGLVLTRCPGVSSCDLSDGYNLPPILRPWRFPLRSSWWI